MAGRGQASAWLTASSRERSGQLRKRKSVVQYRDEAQEVGEGQSLVSLR
jgi:hypothetical protein